VNRHQRRRAEAKARKQLAGYWNRILTAFDSSPTMANELRRRVVSAVIEHDPWCAIYQHCGCSCSPNISLVPFDGDAGVYVVDERGQARRNSRQ
jgi:hypothetical protein